MAQITGHVVQANGTPISEALITITASQHSNLVGGEVLKGTSFDVVCGVDGSYSFQLAVGAYSIQVKTGRTTVSLDNIVVDNATPDGIDILDLVAYEGVSVSLAQQILDGATALSNAQETAVMSAVRANDGVGSGLDADRFQGLTLAQVLAIYPATDTGWIPLTLLNGWVSFGGVWGGPNGVPSCRKLPNGRVEIRGMVKDGTFTHGVNIANLPMGFRPVTPLKYTSSVSNQIPCVLNVFQGGAIQLAFPNNTSVGTNAWVSLNCSFSTE